MIAFLLGATALAAAWGSRSSTDAVERILLGVLAIAAALLALLALA